jgi:arginine decarboxylase
MNHYNIDKWAKDFFAIEDGKLQIKSPNSHKNTALIDIVNQVRQTGQRGPLYIRFPHIASLQVNKLFSSFNHAISEYNYNGSFSAVFPLKVNQNPSFVLPLIQNSSNLNYGLEAGSKAELILATTYSNKSAPITVNGFKDKQMIELGFVVKSMGHNITMIIEGINELESIIEVSKSSNLKCPNIGIRVRLHANSIGKWEKSGGINSKFGLNSTEILEAIKMMKKKNLLSNFTMLHFHIGSSITDIAPLKKALKEVGHIYTELLNIGANNLVNINIGGGLALNYSSTKDDISYSLQEYANDVIFTLKSISKAKNVTEPNIFVESGRFVSAHSTVLVAPVLELFSSEYEIKNLHLKEQNPPIIDELYALYNDMSNDLALEFMHDSLDHLESMLTLFDLGYIDLQDRSNAEVLTNLIIKKALLLKSNSDYTELAKLQERIQEKYLLNFSLFQGISDFWAIKQEFPILPLTKLNQKPTRSATLWDITCDSDGEIPFDTDNPLYLHDISLDEEEYFIGIFMVGAYQEILGMKHNLFAKPSEVSVELDDGKFKISNKIPSINIIDILEDIGYDKNSILSSLKEKIDKSDVKYIEEIETNLDLFLYDNNYLKTTQK